MVAESVTVMCRTTLLFSSCLCVEGLLGITVDDKHTFNVQISDTVTGGNRSGTKMSKFFIIVSTCLFDF